MEIYLERVCDLLTSTGDNLKLREVVVKYPKGKQPRKKGAQQSSVYIEGCTLCTVKTLQEIMKVMRKGEQNRKVASTSMNKRSSRSHSVLILNVIQTNLATQVRKTSQLFMVDLAGSENVGRSQVTGLSLEQAAQINKSLSSLSMVIRALVEKSPHVPYRNSKLTRLLTNSLGGNSKTTLLLALSPATDSLRETVSTLKFGSRAKLVENKAKINQDTSMESYRQMVEDCKQTIQKLKDELKKAQSAVTTETVVVDETAVEEANEKYMKAIHDFNEVQQENMALRQQLQTVEIPKPTYHTRTNSAISQAHSIADIIDNVQEVFGPDDVMEVTVEDAVDESTVTPEPMTLPLSHEEKHALRTMRSMIEYAAASPPMLNRKLSLKDVNMFKQTGNLVVWGEDNLFTFEDI